MRLLCLVLKQHPFFVLCTCCPRASCYFRGRLAINRHISSTQPTKGCSEPSINPLPTVFTRAESAEAIDRILTDNPARPGKFDARSSTSCVGKFKIMRESALKSEPAVRRLFARLCGIRNSQVFAESRRVSRGLSSEDVK